MASCIGRRKFLATLGGATAWPLAARAQQPAMPVIGYLGAQSPAAFASRVAAFRQGLSETGYAEGRNVAIEFRWAEGRHDRLSGLAADLVARHVAVIVAPGGAPAAIAAKSATTSIPIVFEMGAVPMGAVVAVLLNPTSPTADSQLKQLQEAARTLALQLHVLHASTEGDLDKVFATLLQLRPKGLVVASDTFFATHSEQLAALTVRHAVPAIHQSRDFPLAGGLMSYGGSFVESHRQAGLYTGRVLKGDKPADLQQVTKVELLINLKTAKTLGVTFPLALFGRADQVIE